MNWRDLALVTAGGAVGSAMRYLVGRAFGPTSEQGVPWHTLSVNVVGAFAIGLLLGLAARLGLPGWWRPLLAVGVLGGFTTFSTFSLEIVELASRGRLVVAGAYLAASLVLGIGACALGLAVGRAA